MIYPTARVGGPVVKPLVLSISVTDNLPPEGAQPIADSEGVMGVVSDVRKLGTQVRGADNTSDSYVLQLNVTDGQPSSHSVIPDGEFSYGAHPLSLLVWEAAEFTDNDVSNIHPTEKTLTGHSPVYGSGKQLVVTDAIPNPALSTISDPIPLSIQPTVKTGSTDWTEAIVIVTDNRSQTTPHLTVSDGDIDTALINTHYTTADLENRVQIQYWS